MTAEFRFRPRVLQRVRSLIGEGYNGPEIARIIGCSASALRSVCSQHGISLRGGKADVAADMSPPGSMAIALSPDAREVVELKAARMGTTPRRLIEQAIEMMAADDLFGAVLDLR
jgi:hypothetical protein